MIRPSMVEGTEQIWGSYFVIEMIKLSYLGLLGLLQWGTDMYVSQNINGWQLAKMKKSIPDMSLPWNL